MTDTRHPFASAEERERDALQHRLIDHALFVAQELWERRRAGRAHAALLEQDALALRAALATPAAPPEPEITAEALREAARALNRYTIRWREWAGSHAGALADRLDRGETLSARQLEDARALLAAAAALAEGGRS